MTANVKTMLKMKAEYLKRKQQQKEEAETAKVTLLFITFMYLNLS